MAFSYPDESNAPVRAISGGCGASSVAKAFVLAYMTTETDPQMTGGASATSLEGALLKVASDLTEAVAALRLDAERVWSRMAPEAGQEKVEDGTPAES